MSGVQARSIWRTERHTHTLRRKGEMRKSHFGKHVAHWLTNAETKQYLTAFAEALKSRNSDVFRARLEYWNCTYFRPKRGLTAALSPADVRRLGPANRNGEIPFLKVIRRDPRYLRCEKFKPRTSLLRALQRQTKRAGPKASEYTFRRRLHRNNSHAKVPAPSDLSEKYLRERRGTSYTSHVAETEVTRIGVRKRSLADTPPTGGFFTSAALRTPSMVGPWRGSVRARRFPETPVLQSCLVPGHPNWSWEGRDFTTVSGVRNAC